jgi:amphi-Trp domain-containing protein
VSHFEHEERLPRQQAAERLADIAFAFAGGTLELRAEGEQLRVPVAREVLLRRETKSNGDRVDVEVRLRWSA